MSACVAAHRVWFRSSTSCDGHCSSLPAKSIGTFGPVPAGHCRLSENHLASVTPNTALSTLQSPSTPCCARHASASVRVTERGPASPHLGGGNRCRGTSGVHHLAICPEPMRTVEISAAGQTTCQVDLCWFSAGEVVAAAAIVAASLPGGEDIRQQLADLACDVDAILIPRTRW